MALPFWLVTAGIDFCILSHVFIVHSYFTHKVISCHTLVTAYRSSFTHTVIKQILKLHHFLSGTPKLMVHHSHQAKSSNHGWNAKLHTSAIQPTLPLKTSNTSEFVQPLHLMMQLNTAFTFRSCLNPYHSKTNNTQTTAHRDHAVGLLQTHPHLEMVQRPLHLNLFQSVRTALVKGHLSCNETPV